MKKIEFDLDDFLKVEDRYVEDPDSPDGWYTLYTVTLFGVEVGQYVESSFLMHDKFPVYDRYEVEAQAERAVKKLWEMAGE